MREVTFESSFLASHRAQSVASREFARLTDALCMEARALAMGAEADPPEVRLAPNRCIVQLGPVALTVAWLHAGPDLADAELLAIVWNGVIPARGTHAPERGPRAIGAVPVAVEESVFVVRATSENDWRWCRADDDAGCDTEALAADVVARLGAAWQGSATQARLAS